MLNLLKVLPLTKQISSCAALRFMTTCRQCSFKAPTYSYSTSITSKPLHEVNTKVAKDVVLFKYENPKFYTYMNIFAVVQYIFWSYLGLFAFTTLRDAPVDKTQIDETTPWFRKINLGENKYKNTLGIISVLIGTGSIAMIWMYTLKSVRYLILNKGGKHLTFVTYTPFGKNRIMTVPISNVCCKESRSNTRVQLPIKVKNTFMHYMLDMRGEFKNPVLFDCTAGLFRKINYVLFEKCRKSLEEINSELTFTRTIGALDVELRKHPVSSISSELRNIQC